MWSTSPDCVEVISSKWAVIQGGSPMFQLVKKLQCCRDGLKKILVNCLKPILKNFISPNQSAFVSGRMIQDNIIVAHEAFHALKLKKSGVVGNMAIKLDFNKAYDRIEWDFLAAILQKLGYHPKWINWVMECVSTVSFSIFANGEKKSLFYSFSRASTG
ncbi:uncharacterized protein LOC114276380 [Camellia sinensis]|uniref:uncharacterized protein LOC114276380 n=1 Tax=Camellia sinensis TaxID=4442 RepID=UPI0010369B08|nr:uncharacterized protein LOC114276380 [Camellia sinensis]